MPKTPGHTPSETPISKLVISSKDLKEKNFLSQQLDTPEKKKRLTLKEELNYNEKLIGIIAEQQEKLEEEKEILAKKRGERLTEKLRITKELKRIDDIEEAKLRNIDWYTENDKALMLELKKQNETNWEKLVYEYEIDFKENTIVLNSFRQDKVEFEREDSQTLDWNKKMTFSEWEKIAEKEWKSIIDKQFHELSKIFSKEFVIDLFQLENWDYWTKCEEGYSHHQLVYNTEDLSTVKAIRKNNSIHGQRFIKNTLEICVDEEAFVRLVTKTSLRTGGGDEFIIY